MTNRMTWTTNKPTQPGWYWWNGVMWGSTFTKVVEVARYEWKLYIVGFGNLEDFKGYWSGPLPEPDEKIEQQAKEIEAFEELVKMNGIELTTLIKENKTLREALQAIYSGISGDLLGTTSMDRETMQSIAQQALKEVS